MTEVWNAARRKVPSDLAKNSTLMSTWASKLPEQLRDLLITASVLFR
jgi:hypothetical protein